MKLIGADVCRDGGSLSATFERSDGSLLSILLKVTRIPEGGKARRFRHLHVGSNIQNGCDPNTIIAKGSSEEESFLCELDNWIEAQHVSISRIRQWIHLLELRYMLETREF